MAHSGKAGFCYAQVGATVNIYAHMIAFAGEKAAQAEEKLSDGIIPGHRHQAIKEAKALAK